MTSNKQYNKSCMYHISVEKKQKHISASTSLPQLQFKYQSNCASAPRLQYKEDKEEKNYQVQQNSRIITK